MFWGVCFCEKMSFSFKDISSPNLHISNKESNEKFEKQAKIEPTKFSIKSLLDSFLFKVKKNWINKIESEKK